MSFEPNHFSTGGDQPPVITPSFTDKAAPSEPGAENATIKRIIAMILSIALWLYLADAFFSLLDDSAVVFAGQRFLPGLRALASLFDLLGCLVVYGLIGLTPMVPKRLFLALTLSNLLSIFVAFPFMIFFPHRLDQVSWMTSFLQVLLGLWIVYSIHSKVMFHRQLVPVALVRDRLFTWKNLIGFIVANVFVLAPLLALYSLCCTGWAINKYSDGFMTLHPSGFTVETRRYARADGKTIQLIPMVHVADAGFYQKISQSFPVTDPTNTVVLMEGVTDEKNLLTNGISYERMARTLGLAEQHEAFKPKKENVVRADVDVDVFSATTLTFLNLVTLVHAKGITPQNVQLISQYNAPDDLFNVVMNDLLTKRNEHLITEINSHLTKADNIIVPWGVAHMPEVSQAIMKEGFAFKDSHDYRVITFHLPKPQDKEIPKPAASGPTN